MDFDHHKEVHKFLHKTLDELVADFIECTEKFPSETTLIEFMEWSYKQTIEPDEKDEEEDCECKIGEKFLKILEQINKKTNGEYPKFKIFPVDGVHGL